MSTLVIAAPAAAAPTSSDSQENIAVPVIRMSATVRFCFAFSIASSRLGIKMAARMPMIAITIKQLDQRKARLCSPRVYASSRIPPSSRRSISQAACQRRPRCKPLENQRLVVIAKRLHDKNRQRSEHGMSPALPDRRGARVGGQDPAHPLDAAVDLGERDPLVGAVDPLRVVGARA